MKNWKTNVENQLRIRRHGDHRPGILSSLHLRCWLIIPLWSFAFFSLVARLAAQNYTIDWFSIDGGGGASTGGVYSVTGTIGQPDAGGPMTNGQYSVTGGFWALPIAVQTPGGPALTIVRSAPGQATISWSPNTPGFVLQESPGLSPIAWSNSPSLGTNPVTVPAVLASKFYRVFKP